MRWNDLKLLEYAASLKLDAVYLQDSVDPANNDPAHWKVLKETAARLGSNFTEETQAPCRGLRTAWMRP